MVSSSTLHYHFNPILITLPAYFHLYNINGVHPSPNTASILINCLVTSRTDDCNSLLYGLPDKYLHNSNWSELRCSCHHQNCLFPSLPSFSSFTGSTFNSESNLKYYSEHLRPSISSPRPICLISSMSPFHPNPSALELSPSNHTEQQPPSLYISPQNPPFCLPTLS